jgi:enediyne biosynthesis protein E4
MKWDIKHEPSCPIDGHADYCNPKMYKPTPNQLFINNRDGNFRDASVEWGLRSHPGKSMGAATGDFDLDGKMDVFIANDKEFNWFFRNQGTSFAEVGFDVNVALREDGIFISGMGVDFRDLDNDEYPDLVVVALDNETFPLYRNTGKGSFVEVTEPSGMTMLSLPMGGYSPTIADFDNDGWKDIFVSRGHVQSLLSAPRIMVEQPNTVFRNLGGMKFAALTSEAGLTSRPRARHRGSAIGDLNGDGRIDVVVTALKAPAEVWMNESPGSNHWLEIKLQGTKSNRDGIGARIKGDQQRHPVLPKDDGCRLCVVERGPGSFWIGPRRNCRPNRSPVALGYGPAVKGRVFRPDPYRQKTSAGRKVLMAGRRDCQSGTSQNNYRCCAPAPAILAVAGLACVPTAPRLISSGRWRRRT